MKDTHARLLRFLNGRGFYLAVAACMVAIGLATWNTLERNAAQTVPDLTPDTSSNQPIEEPTAQELIPVLPPVGESEEGETEEDEGRPVAAEVAAEHYSLPFDAAFGQSFSDTTLQYSKTYNDWRLHTGLDLIPTGSLVVSSCGAGTVVAVDEGTALGTVITVNHGHGVYFRYCGVNNVTVNAGDTVSEGQALATLGVVTGECNDEAHLHLEALQDGIPVDPAAFLPMP